MAALDKLINLLEQIKQTDPEYGKKAEKALDALISEEDSSPVIEEEPPPPPPPKDPPKEVELTDHHWGDVQRGRTAIAQAVTNLGLVQQNYESDKESLLDQIEQQQESLQKYIESLYDVYGLDKNLGYKLVFPSL